MRTVEASHGRWHEILPRLGVPAQFLNGKHQPCPICGGRDRARFDDRQGDGDYFCSQCGAGKGLKLVMEVNGWDYAEAAKRVDEIIGNLPEDAPARPEPKKVDHKAALRELWKRSQPIAAGDPAWLYLYSRGLKVVSEALRYVPGMYHSETKSEHPGMIAMVCDQHGKPATLHRTYLTKDGKKAFAEKCRKMMPGELPKGGAIRLRPMEADRKLGVAEGIETALSAGYLNSVPVWSTTSEALLQVWQPPKEAKHVVVFGDSDLNFVGQNAAYALAKRLAIENGLKVEVIIPDRAGYDWNDVLLQRGGCGVNAQAA